MKILHVSDTHVQRMKYHEEYRMVFNQIYNLAKKQKVDMIVHTGDIFHSKLELTPEAVNLASEFISNLANIAPFYIIAGNHDTNLKNKTRLDSITPIVTPLINSGKNVTYYKNSGIYHPNDKICFKILSIFDEDGGWTDVKLTNEDKEKVVICLYHGGIAGVQTDMGYTLTHGMSDLSVFEDCDYGLLGDIHQANQIVDTEGKIRYAGSTVQQNFGETNDKGVLIWDIKTKNEYSCKHFQFANPSPYITINLTESGDVPEGLQVLNNAKVRVISSHNVGIDKIKKSIEVVKSKFKPLQLTFLNKAVIDTSKTLGSVAAIKENIRDLSVQERYIRQYLSDFKLEEPIIQKVLELNKKYSQEVQENEDIMRYVNWKLKSLEWNNLFNYGEKNKIDFENLNGIIGIFGPNYSGKSSVIDALLYTAFNTTSKNNRKNINVINQNKDYGSGKLVFSIDGNNYTVSRKTEKYQKKTKGVITTEAKTDVLFDSDSGLLNGIDRSDTDKAIRKYIGSVDDFLLTSMSSQFGGLAFISEGSTKRKEILGKFLDLDTFDAKFKLAKEESSHLKGYLKKTEGTNFSVVISNSEASIDTLKKSMTARKKAIDLLKKEIESIKEKNLLLENKLKDLAGEEKPKESLSELKKKEKEYSSLLSQEEMKLENNKQEYDKFIKIAKKVEDELALIDYEKTCNDKEELDKKANKLTNLVVQLNHQKNIVDNLNKKLTLLQQVPCGDQFKTCKFIKDAHDASKHITFEVDKQNDLLKEQEEISKNSKQDENDLIKLKNLLIRYTELKNLSAQASKKIIQINSDTIANNGRINDYKDSLNKVKENISWYEKRKDLTDLETEKQKHMFEQVTRQKDLTEQEMELNKEFASLGSVAEKLKSSKQQKEEYEKTLEQYTSFDYFLKCMHPSGIPYEIIKNNLPLINAEIQKVLSNIAEFDVYVENDDDKLEIYIKHPNYDARPLDMGSGAEKTLASIAIRLAMINVSSLPKSDIFILDEPGTALDEKNMDGFIKILETIKSQFKTVILISHLEALKECVDIQVTIDKKNGFAYMNI